MSRGRSGGGWQAIRYGLRVALQVGPIRFWKAMRSRNACKTCAVGMGGQLGGMVNETGHFPEVCKKSMQAMAADMRGQIAPQFFENYSVAQMQRLTPRELEHLGRLTQPLVLRAGDTHYKTVSWEEALEAIAASLKRTDPRRAFFYCSGRSSNEAGFLLNLLARDYGTNHLSNCSYYCHQASGVGLKDSIGTGTATIELEDLEFCDLLFLIGGNPASNHPRLMTMLMKLRQRGGKVIVVNPVKEGGLVNFRVPSNLRSMLFNSEIASLYIQPRIGGDIAFCVGVAKRLLEKNALDLTYLQDHTEGFEELRDLVEATSWESIQDQSGVAQEVIQHAADLYCQAERAVFAWTMGITHHRHGTENVQWIANLALLRGMVGKRGAGLLPIRGHSNVQGLGSIGVTPALSKAAVEGLQSFGLSMPEFEGYDTLAALEAAARGEMDFALCLGGNLYGASPDANFLSGALSQIDTVAYMSTALNSGHVHGTGKTTFILPVRVRDEEDQSTTQESMFNFVRLSDGGPARFEGPRTEVDILSDIGSAVSSHPDVLDWPTLKSHEQIRALISRLVPGFEALDAIGCTREEFTIPDRVLHTPKFRTSSGKAQLRSHPIPVQPQLNPNEFLLMTVRSEGQFNTVVYEEEDLYRGQDRRDVILMNPADMERIGLVENTPVEVSNEDNKMIVLARSFDIAAQCALMYYPEANVLVSRTADPRSHTPAYKAARIKVQRASQAPAVRNSILGPGDSQSRDSMKAC